MNKVKQQIFYRLQKECSAWMAGAFEYRSLNWQDFGARHVYENYTCRNGKTVYLVLVVYQLNGPEEYYTYAHCVNFPAADVTAGALVVATNNQS